MVWKHWEYRLKVLTSLQKKKPTSEKQRKIPDPAWQAPFSILDSRLSDLGSRFSILDSRFLILDSEISILGSRFSILESQFWILD